MQVSVLWWTLSGLTAIKKDVFCKTDLAYIVCRLHSPQYSVQRRRLIRGSGTVKIQVEMMRGVFNRKINTYSMPFFMNTVLGPFFMQLSFQNWSYLFSFYRCCQNLRHSVARATMSFMMVFPQTCPVTPFLWLLGVFGVLSDFGIHPASYPFGTDSSLTSCKVVGAPCWPLTSVWCGVWTCTSAVL